MDNLQQKISWGSIIVLCVPMNKTLTQRISWIDICRGIAILLVLYGHALGNDTQRFLIYAFHMPLFFFLSGIVFRLDKTKSFYSTILKNVKSILLPYFLFALLTYITSLILIPPAAFSYESVSKQLFGIIYGSGNEGYLAFNVALWFLPCLFITKVAFTCLTRFITQRRMLITVLVLISIVGFILANIRPDLKMPFGIETAFSASVFFGAGYLWNQSTRLKKIMTNRSVLLFLMATAATVIFAGLNFYLYGTQIDMRLNRLNNYFLFYLGAFSGILGSLLLSMMIKRNILLEYIGKHSLLLFVWHTLLFTLFFKHAFPPVKIEFITPVLTIIFASSIILSIQLLLERIKLARLYKKTW